MHCAASSVWDTSYCILDWLTPGQYRFCVTEAKGIQKKALLTPLRNRHAISLQSQRGQDLRRQAKGRVCTASRTSASHRDLGGPSEEARAEFSRRNWLSDVGEGRAGGGGQGVANSSLRIMKVTQSCSTLCDPMYYTVHGILQARILEWVASLLQRIFPTQKSNPSPAIAGGFLTSWATRGAQEYWSG